MMINPELNIHILDGYKKIAWSEDYYAATKDGKYGLWFYNVSEATMGSYYGHLSIFSEDNLLIISSGEVWISYSKSSTFTYAPQSDCLIFKMLVHQRETNESNYPYLLIKPGSRHFALIDWDFTSLYYSFAEIAKNTLKLKEGSPRELDNLGYVKRTGEEINLDNLTWYDLDDFNNARETYLKVIKTPHAP